MYQGKILLKKSCLQRKSQIKLSIGRLSELGSHSPICLGEVHVSSRIILRHCFLFLYFLCC